MALRPWSSPAAAAPAAVNLEGDTDRALRLSAARGGASEWDGDRATTPRAAPGGRP
eukprot:CAMPEP_0182900968 /NCGR_PEP_ID=MMETSP0034_2-20130328/29275_1 /TAXON_ID=156128 /ORGANISM="Nephroselmis pyriformis, Strain CCMP717" /LENGTH=55 /DNA_ID=CAMNT_0025035283 /DNA_START=92 /DNA_END=256 /DNA_ORIENTATION=+